VSLSQQKARVTGIATRTRSNRTETASSPRWGEEMGQATSR
jgi:hypothetical protein